MERYDLHTTKSIADNRGRLIDDYDKRLPIPKRTAYATVIYPKIPHKAEDIWIRTRIGDRFDTLAHEFYEDVTMWWIIARANKMVYGSLAVEPGIKLRIPIKQEDIVNEYHKINRERI
tara:strand:+ start:486 stop:839 length:354 start_codon:yes stop_codon:yes gene_type:complete